MAKKPAPGANDSGAAWVCSKPKMNEGEHFLVVWRHFGPSVKVFHHLGSGLFRYMLLRVLSILLGASKLPGKVFSCACVYGHLILGGLQI